MAGFTLVEMAVVLVVMGIVMLTILPALTALRMTSQRGLTQGNLDALMRATAAYVQANGCIPCPAPANATGSGFGVIPGYSATAPCGTCSKTTAEGIPPFVSLGIPASTAHDGGGHWISMRIDPLLANPSNPLITPPSKPVACACSVPSGNTCTPTPANCACSTAVNNVCTPLPAGLSQQGLCTANLSKNVNALPIQISTPNGGTQQAAVIFISYGMQGFGSFAASALASPYGTNGARLLPFPSNYPSCSSGGYARCNAQGNGQFVDAAMSGIYDDILAFADRNTLVSMFGNGSCQTVW